MRMLWRLLLDIWQIRYESSERFGRWQWVERLRALSVDFCVILADVFRTALGAFWLWTKNEVRYWRCFFKYGWQDFRILFGRPKKVTHTFTWWTYYVAVTRSLQHARMAKYSWQSSIDAETVCVFYERYEGVQKRAREQGYVRLAKEGIHDKWVLKELEKV